MPRRALGLVLALASAAAQAHDFWLQPAQWRAEPAAPIELSLLVGHGPDRRRSPIPASRIVRFEAIHADGGRVDLRGQLHVGDAKGDATIHLQKPGAYLLLLETDDRAESHLPSIRYNDYLKTEGLTPAIELRARAGRTVMDGSENYSRHAKSIVQIGKTEPGALAALTKPYGLALEIVPEESLLAARPGSSFAVRIYYQGQPLGGALVKLTDLARDAEPVEMKRSDPNGRAVFELPKVGSWLLNVIWTRPQQADGANDFETDFSSLSFNLPPEE